MKLLNMSANARLHINMKIGFLMEKKENLNFLIVLTLVQ